MPRPLHPSRLCSGFGAYSALSAAVLTFGFAVAQTPPGIPIPAEGLQSLTLEPAGLATYAAALPGVGSTAGIRYQLDLAWVTSETPSAGTTHDSLTFSLLSLDGSQALAVVTLDVLGLQVLPGSGVSVLIDPASRPQDLSYRLFLVPPSDLLTAGSWALYDLADTGPLGGSSALASIALVPEPGTVALGILGSGLLALHVRPNRKGKEVRR